MMMENWIVPTLRFPQFSDNWKTKRFKEIFTFFATNSFSRTQLNYEYGDVKNIHYGDIHTKFQTNFRINDEKVPFINPNETLSKISGDSYCIEGDLIIADASEDYKDVGKSIEIIELNGEKLLAGLHTYIARDLGNYTVKGFKGYLMQSIKVRKQIMVMATGSSVLGVTKTNVGNVILHLPTISEQQKIADFLTIVDTKIQQLTRKKTLLEKYKRGVSQKLFNQEIRFKDEDGKDFPDWETKRLGDNNKIFDGTHMTPNYQTRGVPFYSVEQVTGNDFTKTKFISEDVFFKENNRVRLEKGDILMTRIGDIGTTKYISWDVKASFYVSLALVKKTNTTWGPYLDQYFKSNQFQKEVWKRTIHAAFPKKINLGELGNCLIKLPTIKEQQMIADFLTRTDEKITFITRQLQHTQTFKKGLLQQMFI